MSPTHYLSKASHLSKSYQPSPDHTTPWSLPACFPARPQGLGARLQITPHLLTKDLTLTPQHLCVPKPAVHRISSAAQGLDSAHPPQGTQIQSLVWKLRLRTACHTAQLKQNKVTHAVVVI